MSIAVQKQKLYINGKWREAKSYTELKSPYSRETIAEISVATEQEVDEAIAAAYAARQTMAAMPAHERAAILERVGE